MQASLMLKAKSLFKAFDLIHQNSGSGESRNLFSWSYYLDLNEVITRTIVSFHEVIHNQYIMAISPYFYARIIFFNIF